MTHITDLTNKALHGEPSETVEVSLFDLAQFFVVYPEMIHSGSVRMADIADIILGHDIDEKFVLTTKPLTKLFQAVEVWLKHVIITSISKDTGTSRIVLRVDVSNTNDISYLRCEPGELQTVNWDEFTVVARDIGYNLAKDLQQTISDDIRHNVVLLRKVKKYGS